MRPIFHPQLVNDPFGDPGLYVEFLFEKRALLFDLGDLRALAPRKILRLSDVFVSHAHMDHFVGFDQLLRICLGREKRLRLYGPPGFIDQVEHKLSAYTWNLVHNYPADLTLEVLEIRPDGTARRDIFRCRKAFRREGDKEFLLPDNVLLDETVLRVRTTFLDHKTPCLAFALEEKLHINVWKNRLEEMQLITGPWLQTLKKAVLGGAPDDTLIQVHACERGAIYEKWLPLGLLKEKILRIVPGQKITYVTDAVYHEQNAKKIVALAQDSDILAIETTFLEEDAERAMEKYHLTARQAGMLARAAHAKKIIPFHFSPKYAGEELRLREELHDAYTGNR